MTTIVSQLESYRSSLASAQANGNQAVARKLEQQIKELEDFQVRHPEAEESPSPFEVFCELNPLDEKCRVYDD